MLVTIFLYLGITRSDTTLVQLGHQEGTWDEPRLKRCEGLWWRHCVSPRILVGKQRTGEDWEDTRPGNLLQFAIENGHRNSEISHDTW